VQAGSTAYSQCGEQRSMQRLLTAGDAAA
jgi:hypothetical protein